MKVPYISTWRDGDSFHAAFGFSLERIQHEVTLANPYKTSQPGDSWKEAHQRNVRLVQILSRWPHPCSVELHIVSHPSLESRVPGWNQVGLLFHVSADDELTAIELAIGDSIHFCSLLESFWGGAQFSMVAQECFDKQFRPFAPGSCLLVSRRAEINPGQPFAGERPAIGFQTHDARAPEREKENITGDLLRHVYPWVPSFGEDWSVLLAARV